MAMSGCSVVQMVESHEEAFRGATSGKKITKDLHAWLRWG